jgi:hypothetical protein
MKTKLLIVFNLFVVVIINQITSVLVYSQIKDQMIMESFAIKEERTRGDDDNIISDTLNTNDPNSNITIYPRPDSSAVSNNGIYKITLQNFTKWIINLFEDGFLIAIIPPNSDIILLRDKLNNKFYAKAFFTDGSFLSWKSGKFNPQYDNVWQLKDEKK